MRDSTCGHYASRAPLSLALHPESSPPLGGRDRRTDRTSQPYLEQILLAFKGAGLVRSKRGVGGDYVLARDTTDIRLPEIIRAVDGPSTTGDFGEPPTKGACDHEGQCVLRTIWGGAGAHMRGFLDSFSLADIAAMAQGEAPWVS